ncbi:WD repeat and SOCS box-containing protein 1, partial [Taenia solium]
SDTVSKYLTYENPLHLSVTFCAFSHCGDYFGFIENRRHVRIYQTSDLLRYSSGEPINGVVHTNGESLWHWNDAPVNLAPVVSIEATGDVDVNFIAFGDGDISRCRLPHRLAKRCSVVTKRPDQVCVIAMAKSNGYIEVYNLNLLKEHYSPILSKMVLFDGAQSILHLTMSMEGALRLASTSYGGVVKLWDIWDDGNMYATLTSPTAATLPSTMDLNKSEVAAPYNHEATVTAWHPHEGHLFLGGKQGHGLVLEDERPFRCLHLVRQYHWISGAVYSRDGDFLITASFDGICTLWHMPTPCNIRLLGGANDFHVTSLALSPDSESFVTLCEDGLGDRRLQVWSQTPCVQSSLAELCAASIRRHVVSSLFMTHKHNGQEETFSVLATLPLPKPLRLLLCHGLKACAKL